MPSCHVYNVKTYPVTCQYQVNHGSMAVQLKAISSQLVPLTSKLRIGDLDLCKLGTPINHLLVN